MTGFFCIQVFLLGLLLVRVPLFAASTHSFDVVVYGASSGGTAAAIAAGRSGMRVALLEPGKHVGGMLSGGLSNADVDNQQNLIGGIAREFFVSAGAHYSQPISWAVEPHVAEHILNDMLREAHVQTFFASSLESVTKKNAEILAIHTDDGQDFAGAVFIDGSYEGDLLKAAGVSYTIGREGREQYKESLAGRQDLLPGHHQFKYAVPANFNGGLLPWVVRQRDVVPTGVADGKFQSYCFRLCLTDDPANRLPIGRPNDYTAERYLLAKRYLESAKGALSLRDFLGIIRIPNHKADINSTGPVSTDLLGASWEYPDASPIRRQQIWTEHLTWAQGLLYFLQNDSSVPDNIRSAVAPWGLPKDEFEDTGHWPHQLYIRQARRMLGEFVLTQHDLQEYREKYDSIGMAGYNIDIREVQWLTHKVFLYPKMIDQVFTEGYISMPVDPWQIPFRALLPRQEEASNLLVPVCVSASTIAYGSFRMEANYMIAGQSAGVAAALAIKSKRPIHLIDIAALQKTLRGEHQVLSLSDAEGSEVHVSQAR